MVAKGELAEAAVRYHMLRAGLELLQPIGDRHPFDLIVLHRDRVIRVQVKHGRLRDGRVICNGWSTDHGRGPQSYVGRADVIATYVPELDQTFVVDVADVRTHVWLRTEPPRNNQRAGIRMADDHTLEKWVARLSG